MTLCCILLPVVTQTALQPLFFFERAWSLFFLRQMGHDLLDGSLAALAAGCRLLLRSASMSMTAAERAAAHPSIRAWPASPPRYPPPRS